MTQYSILLIRRTMWLFAPSARSIVSVRATQLTILALR